MKIELEQVQKMLNWLKTKLFLDSVASSSSSRIIRHGQVYRCNFGCGIGSEMQKDRPAVIIQNDIGNNHSGNTIVIPITHDTSTLPCVSTITPQTDSSGNIILDGQANASNIMCVSKARLGSLICSLPKSDMKRIDETIAKTVNIMHYYSTLTQQLNDKLIYISKLKLERNKAQDEIAELRNILDLSEKDSIVDYISNMKISIDNQQ